MSFSEDYTISANSGSGSKFNPSLNGRPQTTTTQTITSPTKEHSQQLNKIINTNSTSKSVIAFRKEIVTQERGKL
jgi:hypothetical protein